MKKIYKIKLTYFDAIEEKEDYFIRIFSADNSELAIAKTCEEFFSYNQRQLSIDGFRFIKIETIKI